jgi:NADH-quinone oxidoreductase subunit C
MENVNVIADSLNEKFGGSIGVSDDGKSLLVKAEEIIPVLTELKKNFNFSFLADLTAVDYPDNFTVVYHLMRLTDARIIRVKVLLDKDNPHIDSAVTLWHGANVMERETFDLMGIIFDGHPDLKRILCPDDFEGHPLRKDFKVEAASRQ